MKEEEALKICFKKNYLNDDGLKRMIAYNNGEVIDVSDDIKNITKTSTYNGDLPLKEANKRKKN